MARVYHAAFYNEAQSSIEQKCAGMAKLDADAFVTNMVKRGKMEHNSRLQF